MFSTCSELSPRAPIPDGRMEQIMQPWPDFEGLGRQMVDTRPTIGSPLKTWGIMLQIGYVEGRWNKNWAHTSLLHFFPSWNGNSRKSYFWCKTLPTRKFSTGRFFGAGTHGILMSLRQFWSDRLETNRTWSPNIGAYVLFVSKWTDKNWRSDFDLQHFIYDATNVKTRINFGRL